jgi:predicted metal-dependent hydrolase
MASYNVPHRDVRTRRIRFDYSAGTLARHYVQGDLVMSHAVAVLSALFPPGEDYFVRSVRYYAGEVTDPELKQQVAGFIGQEVTHGREHRELNRRLQEMGFPTHRVSRWAKGSLARLERIAPPIACLAHTAALEHYTAVVAETLLTKPEAQELLGDSEVRNILLWHALEESEHKAVAFDVFRSFGGTERRRKAGFALASLGLLSTVIVGTALSMFLTDRSAWNPVRLIRSLWRLRTNPFLQADVRRRITEYRRAGFHPDDHDATQLLDRWREELFGEQGSLTDHLR